MTEADARALLVALFATPMRLDVEPAVWRAAAALGGLRQAANDLIRAPHRSRGDAKNAAGDLQGSFGELLVGLAIEKRLPDAIVTCTPLNWDEPGDDVDVHVTVDGHDFLVETKCHLHEPGKRLFLINSVAAERSRARGAKSFIPVLASTGSASALVGRPLLLSRVFSWPLRDFGYGDAARAADLERFVVDHFGLPLANAVDDVCGESVVAREGLIAAAATARGRFPELRSAGIPIPSQPSLAVELFANLGSTAAEA